MILTKDAQAMVEANLARFAIPGAVVALMQGDARQVLPYGLARPGLGRPVDEATLFSIASCSKAFTATLIAILASEGRLSFEDPVRKHLPEFTMDDPWITEHATLRDLLGMRLGLAREGLNNWGRNRDVPHAVVFERLQYMTRIAGFREAFTYLNPAYTALAEIVSRVTGQPFSRVLSDRLLDPLGMTDSFLDEGWPAESLCWATPHVVLDGALVALPQARCGGREGESCMYVSGRDAVRWLAANLSSGALDGRPPIPAEALAAVHAGQIVASPAAILGQSFAEYCMGWSAADSRGRRVLTHTGSELGSVSYTLLCPESGIGVAVYAACDRMAAVMSTAMMVFDHLIDAPATDWGALFLKLGPQEEAAFEAMVDSYLPVPPDTAPITLEPCVGTYESGHSGQLRVALVDGRLTIRLDEGDLFAGWLEPLGGSVFRPRLDDPGAAAGLIGRSRLDFVIENGRATAVRAFGLGQFWRIDDRQALR